MVIQHFNLGIQPFGVTPDAKFLYLSRTHREALASLLYGIRSGRGFTALIAPPGMGKTTLLFQVLKLLKENTRTAFLFQTLCGPEEFLRSLLADLGIAHEADDVTRMHAKLNAYLVEESKNGREVVVVVDEAQNLDNRVLELVRMLSNFETPGRKLMHLILSGQPQLAEKLASEQLIQLRQRISIIARLNPFSAEETRQYIEHRLHVAGDPGDQALFSDEAYAAIANYSAGIPRNINNLCFNSMSLACALKQSQVDALMVRETINDLDLTTITTHPAVKTQPPPPSFTFLTLAPPAAGLLRNRIVFTIALLGVLAVGSNLWITRTNRVLANHSTNAASDSAPPRQSIPTTESGQLTGRTAVANARRSPEGLHNSQASSVGNSSHIAPEVEETSQAPNESSVPAESTPRMEKP